MPKVEYFISPGFLSIFLLLRTVAKLSVCCIQRLQLNVLINCETRSECCIFYCRGSRIYSYKGKDQLKGCKLGRKHNRNMYSVFLDFIMAAYSTCTLCLIWNPFPQINIMTMRKSLKSMKVWSTHLTPLICSATSISYSKKKMLINSLASKSDQSRILITHRGL